MLRRIAKLLNVDWSRVVCAELLLAAELAHRSEGGGVVTTSLVRADAQGKRGAATPNKQRSTLTRYAAVGG
jgi:hypothetical protein